MQEVLMPDQEANQHDLHELAEAAESLQAKVNLHIGWATIIGRPVSQELYDANAKLVDAARQLRVVARQASEDEGFRCGVRQAEQAADREPAVNGV
jgi:hypothetical protein